MVVRRALVGAVELAQEVLLRAALVELDRDHVGRDLGDHARSIRRDDVAGVDGCEALHAGADERRLAADERHGLALHVRTHEGAVGVVVLEERDEARRDRHHLARRDVHVVDLGRDDELDLLALATGDDALLDELLLRVQAVVRVGDDELVLLRGGQVVDLRGDDAVATRRYGVSMKPNELMRAKVASEPMRPMFGPSGVSIGHMRP